MRDRFRKLFALLAAASACMIGAATILAPADAAAQPPDAGGDEIQEAARQLYDEAKDARQKEEWARCHAKAAAAWAIHPHLRIGALFGDCAIAIGRYAEGAEPLANFLAAPEASAISADLRTHLERRLAEAKQHIAIVKLTASVPGAIAKVDGTLIPKLPATLYLDPGQRAFDATHPDREAAHEERVLGAGTETALELTLPPRKPKGNPVPIPVPNGDDGDAIPVAVPIVAGVLAAGSFALGIASVVLMSSASSDIDDASARIGQGDSACNNPSPALAGDCSTLQSAAEDHDLFQTLTIVGFAAGGALTAATVSMLVYNASTHAAVTVAPTLGGFVMSGRF
jgi:hypothetical protein